MKKLSGIFQNTILILSGLGLLTVLLSGLISPPHNLLTVRILPVTVFLVGSSILVSFIFPRLPERSEKLFAALFYLLLFLYGLLIYYLNITNRLYPNSLIDYDVMTANARSLSEGNYLAVPDYFIIAPNNFKPTLVLALLFRLSDALKQADSYAFVLLLFTAWTMLSVLSCAFLIDGKNAFFYRFLLVLFFLFLLPSYVHSGTFYTDSMTFGTAPVCFFLLKQSKQSLIKRADRIFPPLFLAILSGLIFGLGFSIKVTAAIPFIALAILSLLSLAEGKESTQSRKRAGLYILLPFLLSFCILYSGFETYSDTYPEYKKSAETCEPAIAYVALGLQGNGSFDDNREFAYYERFLPAKAEKASYSKDYLRANATQFVNPSHLFQKTSFNFQGGFLGADNFVDYPQKENNLFYHLFQAWGKYYWRTSQYCYLYADLLFGYLLFGVVYCLILRNKKKEVPSFSLLGPLAFLGIFLFLYLWEANNRQLYNQIPILFFGVIQILKLVRENNPRRKA